MEFRLNKELNNLHIAKLCDIRSSGHPLSGISIKNELSVSLLNETIESTPINKKIELPITETIESTPINKKNERPINETIESTPITKKIELHINETIESTPIIEKNNINQNFSLKFKIGGNYTNSPRNVPSKIGSTHFGEESPVVIWKSAIEMDYETTVNVFNVRREFKNEPEIDKKILQLTLKEKEND